MGIMDHFRPVAPVAAPAVSGPPAALTTATPLATPVPPVDPSVAPLEPFKSMWENDPKYKAPGTDPIFAASDPAKLMEAARTMDFTSMITPEIHARIAAGGADAQAAMQEAMRISGSHVYAQNAHATTEIVKRALEKQEANLMAKLPGYLKNQNVSASLSELNPALSHPAMQPMVSQVQQQMQLKYPTATPAEITTQVSNYFDAVAKISSGQKEVAPTSSGTDWDKFL